MSTVEEQLVDAARLETYLADRLPGEGQFEVVRHIAGHSNETFFVTRGDSRWVLRRPPLAVYLPTAHDVLREYRVISTLGQTQVRVPDVALACEDTSVIGAPFYLMQKVDGAVLRDSIPGFLDNETDHAEIGTELVTALAELHSVDWMKVGLEGFGKPTGYLQRQVRRWTGQLELATSITSQSREVPDMWKVRDWLSANMPESGDPVIVHGDYKLDNVIYAPSSPARLAAILDWEMSTIGDPLSDLGWLISFWIQAGDPPDPLHSDLSRLTTAPGSKTRAELIDIYASKTGRKVGDIRWYVVAAVWKLACLLEGSYGRHLLDTTDDPFFARLQTGKPMLAKGALDIAAGGMDLT
ncbi:MAG: phosphotransferase family protein [Actinobacteria bacterium]|nr:phosphotransferase family protein [Actinomycetota bacterium]